MKAVRIARTGGPEVLDHVDLPLPVAGPHDVLVRTLAIGVGMPDILVRRGVYAWMPKLPAIIGIESAGVIDAVGDAVCGLRVGQQVYVNARDLAERSGGYAEFRAVPADSVHPLADTVDPVKAAALGNYQVAESLLRMAAPFPQTRTLAVIGAAGGVGTAAIQLGVLRGMRVIGVAGSDDKCEWVRGLGAAAAVNYRSERIADGILRTTGGAGADLILDPVGGDTLPQLFEALAPLGLVVAYGGLGGEPDPGTIGAMRKRFGASPGLRLFSMHSWDAMPDLRRDIARTVIEHLEQGRIEPQIDRCYPLSQSREAHIRFEQRQHAGKLVLVP